MVCGVSTIGLRPVDAISRSGFVAGPWNALFSHASAATLGAGPAGAGAAGAVIESFGHFLIGGNFAVGLIVFAILITVLIVRPSGLLGKGDIKKV